VGTTGVHQFAKQNFIAARESGSPRFIGKVDELIF
jgi:hypothetical protein